MTIDADMERLKNATYPGRGIVIGQTPNTSCMVQIYWIMGRSPSSRNRVFVREGDAVKTDTVDKSHDIDPLTMYYPIRVLGDAHIVTNGDQTDTIVHALQNGGSFESALKKRTYEPDAPNFTPRISGLTDLGDSQAYRLSVLKTVGGDARYCSRQFFNYETAIPGTGHCITTYIDDGNPLPSFQGEPYAVELFDDIQQTADIFWSLLDEDNRVSLLVKYIHPETADLVIVNKYGSG